MAESKGLVARFHAWPGGVISGTRRESKGSWGIVLLEDEKSFLGVYGWYHVGWGLV